MAHESYFEFSGPLSTLFSAKFNSFISVFLFDVGILVPLSKVDASSLSIYIYKYVFVIYHFI